MNVIRAPSHSRKPLRLAYDSLRLASQLKPASPLKPASRGFYGGGISYGGLQRLTADWRIIYIINYSHTLATPLTLLICNICASFVASNLYRHCCQSVRLSPKWPPWLLTLASRDAQKYNNNAICLTIKQLQFQCLTLFADAIIDTRPVFFRYCCTVLIHGPCWLTIYADCSRSIWDVNVSYWVSNGRIM